MEIKILGTGCSNCKRLEANVREAIANFEEDIKVTKVENIQDIMKYGVMRTPAVVIDEKVKAFGKVSTVADIKKFIEEEK